MFAKIFGLVIGMTATIGFGHEIEKGVSWTLAQQRYESISNVKYTVSFLLSPAEKVTGGVAITFDLKDKSNPVVVDFQAPKESVKSVKVNYRPAEYEFRNGHIVISADTMEVGENVVLVDFVSPDQSLNRSEEFLYTLLVPDRASTVFPCFDQPDVKASFTLQLDVPANWEASSNGAVERVTPMKAAPFGKTQSRKLIVFEATKPISTYLFAFAAGEFKKISRDVDGRSMTMLHRESDQKKVDRNVDKIFQMHAISLQWMEDYTQIEYPFAKFDFVLIPSFQYGGMEHIGNIFYNADQLLLDETATRDQKLNRASLIAHETAHMWFGDLVTMKWFDDVWLKEVFANFMAAKIVHPSFKDINHDLRFMLKHHPSAYGEDRSDGTYPIQQKLDNLSNAGTLYGRIIYQKAPVVMRQLETMIGEAKLRDGLREYLRKFSYGNAVWDDLIEILDAKTEMDLTAWSRAWVKESGAPELATNLSSESGKKWLTIEQVKKTASDQYWTQQVDLKVYSGGNLVYESRTTIDGANTKVELPGDVGEYDFFLANGSELGYGYFKLDARSRDWLSKNVHAIEDDVTRGAAWLAMYESLIRDGSEDSSAKEFMNSLLNGLRNESEPLNRQNLLEQMQTVFWKLCGENEREGYAKQIEACLWHWIDQEDVEEDAKSAYYKALANVAIGSESVERLFQVWESRSGLKGLKLSENDYMDLAYELAIRMPDRSDDILNEQLERMENEDRKKRLAFVSPALSPDPGTRGQFFESLKEPGNRRPERWALEALHYLHHPLRASESEKFILPGLELLEEIQSTGDIFFPKRWLVETFSGHRSKSAASVVDKFLDDRPDYPFRLKNKILQAADLLLRINR